MSTSSEVEHLLGLAFLEERDLIVPFSGMKIRSQTLRLFVFRIRNLFVNLRLTTIASMREKLYSFHLVLRQLPRVISLPRSFRTNLRPFSKHPMQFAKNTGC